MVSLIKNTGSIGLPLIVFSLLVYGISQDLNYWSWDRSILLAIHQTEQPYLDRLASTLTSLGTSWGVLPGSILLVGFLFARQRWRQGLYALTTMLGAALISRTLKVLFHRERPHFWDLFFPLPADFSFPSGHALFSLTFVITVIVLAWNSRWRWVVVLMGGSFAIAIAWTRLYLGVHYPSDILGGWSIAIAWTLTVGRLLGLPQDPASSASSTVLP